MKMVIVPLQRIISALIKLGINYPTQGYEVRLRKNIFYSEASPSIDGQASANKPSMKD